jgi:TonB family protein
VKTSLTITAICWLLVCPCVFGQKTSDSGVRISCPPVRQKLIKIIRPTYPEEAKQARIEGTVSLKCLIGLDGSIERIDVEKGHELLAPAATRVVSQWKYEPLLLNGKAVQTETTVNIIFQLPKESASPILISHNDVHGPLGGERRVEDVWVYSDGKVVYSEEANENRELKMMKSRYEVSLAQEQLQRLITLLQSKEVRSLPSRIPPQRRPIDFFWEKTFEINQNGRTQKLKIDSFYPFLNKHGKAYPQAVIELECTLQDIQAKAHGQTEGPKWCADLLKKQQAAE